MKSDSPEFLEILAKVPRWHMLDPEVDLYKDMDEYLDIQRWHEVSDTYAGKPIPKGSVIRRPIPENVRRSMAWWSLYNQLSVECSGGDFGWLFSGVDSSVAVFPATVSFGLRKFSTRETAKSAIPILGGDEEIIRNLQDGPGAYMRWVLGNQT